MDNDTKEHKDRERLLRAVYAATEGDTIIGKNYFELGAALGLSRAETQSTMDYIVHVSGFTQYTSLSDACMTRKGVVEMERILQAEKPATPQQEWRKKFEALSIEELEDALATQRFGHERSPKAKFARNVLEAKREKNREGGEVAALKAKISQLEQELRDKSATLHWTRLGVIAAFVVPVLVAWRVELEGLFKSAVVALADLFSWTMAALKR